jgi:hypothetical protein
MFLLDDLLLSPARGLFAVFRNVHDAAQEEIAHEAEDIRMRLSEIYVMLETGQLNEDEFERRERELLDRLEDVEARSETEIEEEDESEDEDEDEEDESDDDDDVFGDDEEDEDDDEDPRFDA